MEERKERGIQAGLSEKLKRIEKLCKELGIPFDDKSDESAGSTTIIFRRRRSRAEEGSPEADRPGQEIVRNKRIQGVQE
ncbi:MAG: hypothetical protein IPM63_13475 [Acidobacteriota bacterium]|nr:MAG: hypothetical protein IPM63_13475 [Acidobacteriota bacterium]